MFEKIDALANYPVPPKAKRLQGNSEYLRIRLATTESSIAWIMTAWLSSWSLSDTGKTFTTS